MEFSNNKPILVTGSHRSGSTWVGKVVSLPSQVAYIHEPFNLDHRPGICKAEFKYWFSHICKQNESSYLNALEDTLNFRYSFDEELKAISSIKDFLRLFRDYSRFTSYRLLSKRPLIKDPIAIFSAEWLAKRFNMDVIVLIRHPAAFAGSLKKTNWTYPFDHLLGQPLLMEKYLDKYSLEIEEYSKAEKDIVDQAILLWNLIHHIVLSYKESNSNWLFIRHEDLSRHPMEEFRSLYNSLDLKFSKDIQKRIELLSFADSDKEKDSFDSIKRDSKSNILKWKTRLTDNEIKKIKEKTGEIANKFYTEEDWL